MQFRKTDKERIRSGELNVSFRAWKSPRAKPGGRYNLHPEGAIEVTRVAQCTPGTVRTADLRAAGFESKKALAEKLGVDTDDDVYQVEFRYLGPELVNQPSQGRMAGEDVAALLLRLGKMDERSARGPWTSALLQSISQRPATRAADLAASIGWETPPFKEHVRRLKKLGLTRSLKTGYALSPRGEQVLDRLQRSR